MEKDIPNLKAEFMCMCLREKKKNSFKNSCNHFNVCKKFKSPIQKGF